MGFRGRKDLIRIGSNYITLQALKQFSKRRWFNYVSDDGPGPGYNESDGLVPERVGSKELRTTKQVLRYVTLRYLILHEAAVASRKHIPISEKNWERITAS